MTRVAVFLDYQNVYMGARKAFDWHGHFTYGQVYPRRLGLLLTKLGHQVDPGRQLEYVKVYRGEPSGEHSPGGQAACHRQVEYWNAQARVEAITRPLKYYELGHDWQGNPRFEAREKGIDVLVALGMVMGAMRDAYDVAVLFTSDTDLAPAVETVLDLGKRCEVASWRSKTHRQPRLSVPGRSLWCHWLDRQQYNQVCDSTDYTRPQPEGPENTASNART